MKEHAAGVDLALKVVPGASRTAVVGVWGTALKLAVAAPPEGGRANAAILRLLAEVFGVRRGEISIEAGQAQPRKTVRVRGITVETARSRLTSFLSGR
ncbi:MAG: DUF167 domain-containing protein [Planctomycetes bacterium]|nr:DUF167 domain-containing protein [Planctomycetota bacterium]